jgi:signal transduction histidine kinase
MGFYNAKKIIERHEGRLWAENEGENLLDAGLNYSYYNYCNYS